MLSLYKAEILRGFFCNSKKDFQVIQDTMDIYIEYKLYFIINCHNFQPGKTKQTELFVKDNQTLLLTLCLIKGPKNISYTVYYSLSFKIIEYNKRQQFVLSILTTFSTTNVISQ